MRGNLNEVDRLLRVLTGMILIATGMTYSAALVPVAAVTLVSGMVGWCPLYSFLEISTDCQEERA